MQLSVFHTSETSADYEPPHFNAADEDKNRWYFMTHDLDEVPDKVKSENFETGPRSTEQDDLVFAGTTYSGAQPTLSPIQEAMFCK